MSVHNKLRKHLYSSVGPAVLVAMSLATSDSGRAWTVCQGPGAPTTTQTKCLTAVAIPAAPANKTGGLQSFDISWVNPDRAEYYLGDRANAGITIVDTKKLTFKRTIGGFTGVVLNGAGTAVNNNVSGPDGVTSHGRWVYAGDGDSTLKVIDLDSLPSIKIAIPTGGATRVDEMALTTDGKLLLAANNAEDPPFATLFHANGDSSVNMMSTASIISKIVLGPQFIQKGDGLSMEQPAWDPKTKRFYVSVPVIRGNPTGCDPTATGGPTACDGGMAVIDPSKVTGPLFTVGDFDPTTNTGVVKLHACGPNGSTVGPHDNLMLGCTPGNNSNNTTTLVINAKTKNYANIANITGSDEVWFNSGDRRYYLGASKMTKPAGSPLGNGAVLGVVDGTSVLIESIPQSSNSHSVAADSKRNRIFVPQVQCCGVGPSPVIGGDVNTTAGAGSPTVGQLLCGSSKGCIAVYQHDVDDDDHDGDDDHDKHADNH
jgi:hypothetical protein